MGCGAISSFYSPDMSTKTFTREEVAKHSKPNDLWIIVDSKVYDLSRFGALHPGGLSVLLDVAGKDATEAFFGLHRHEVLSRSQYARLQIGTVAGERQQIVPRAPGALSEVPYAEPTWLTKGYHSPYYKDHHHTFQAAYRKFFDEVIWPDARLREQDGKRPDPKVMHQMAESNVLAVRLGPGPHLKGRTILGGAVKPEEVDYFHELIAMQEAARMHALGHHDGLGAGPYIGLPLIMRFAKPALRDKILTEVLSGEKYLCLCVSEAFAGSDVAGMKSVARKSADGKYYTVTGTKKWITNGHWADYFVIACRTEKGMVVLVTERVEGVETKLIKTSYSTAAGTAFVTFDDVKIPAENLLGPEDGGLVVVLSNFNHERWGMTAGAIGAHRTIVEECLKWANQRKVFGKPLISQAVVRSKLAAMIARVEAAQNWIEHLTHQMCNMDYKEQSDKLAGQIAFLKMFATQTAQATATDAVQIFGGRGITRTGMGQFIEHYHRTVTFNAVYGGAEDVLADLGVRQAMKGMPRNTRL